MQNEDNAEKAGSTSDGKIDINTAAKNELMTLQESAKRRQMRSCVTGKNMEHFRRLKI